MNLGIFATPALSTTTTTTTMGWIRKTPEVHDEQRVVLINQGPNILNYGRSFLCIGLIKNHLNNKYDVWAGLRYPSQGFFVER